VVDSTPTRADASIPARPRAHPSACAGPGPERGPRRDSLASQQAGTPWPPSRPPHLPDDPNAACLDGPVPRCRSGSPPHQTCRAPRRRPSWWSATHDRRSQPSGAGRPGERWCHGSRSVFGSSGIAGAKRTSEAGRQGPGGRRTPGPENASRPAETRLPVRRRPRERLPGPATAPGTPPRTAAGAQIPTTGPESTCWPRQLATGGPAGERQEQGRVSAADPSPSATDRRQSRAC